MYIWVAQFSSLDEDKQGHKVLNPREIISGQNEYGFICIFGGFSKKNFENWAQK